MYYDMQVIANGMSGPSVSIHAKNGATLDPSNVTPITTTPVVTAPTGDTTYGRLDGGNSPFTGLVQFNAGILTTKSTIGSGSPNGSIAPRLSQALDGSSSAYLTGITALTPTSYDAMWNGTAQTGAGYAAYARRIDQTTQAGIDVSSSVGLGVFNNAHSTNSSGAVNYDKTNQVALVANSSALDSGSSASVFAANFIVASAYSGAIPQRQVGLEIDCNPTRDANADGGTTGPWALGALITNNSSTGGTVDGTIGVLVRGSSSTHGYKIGGFFNGRLVGAAIGTEQSITPDTGLWIRSATTWGIYIGSRAIESSTYFNSGMTLSNPAVGIEIGETGTTSAVSNRLRLSAKDSGSSSLIWDHQVDATGNYQFQFASVVKLQITSGGNGSVTGTMTATNLIATAATPTVSAGQIGIGTSTGFGNGTGGTAVTTTTKGTGSGPVTPQTVVNYLKVNSAGTDYWIPLVQ